MKKERVFIKLHEIPEKGRSYHYDRSSAEFNDVLSDLIENNPYTIDFSIRPIGNVFEVHGSVHSQFNRVCSYCGVDIQVPVQIKINELLLPKPTEEKGDTQSKKGFVGSDEDSSLSVTYFSHGILNAEELIHELLGLCEPGYPLCAGDRCTDSEVIKAKMSELETAANKAVHSPQNPFAVLKNLKPH